MIAQINYLVNRRPIAFAAALRDDSLETLPAAITPEILLHGRELVSVKVIPQYEVEEEPDWLHSIDALSHIRDSHSKLVKARKYLTELYHGEFLGTLIGQATDRDGRYRKINHR